MLVGVSFESPWGRLDLPGADGSRGENGATAGSEGGSASNRFDVETEAERVAVGAVERLCSPVSVEFDVAVSMKRAAKKMVGEYLAANDLVRARKALELLASLEEQQHEDGGDVVVLDVERERRRGR